eukprot:5742582-Amphidinium_carterae.1
MRCCMSPSADIVSPKAAVVLVGTSLVLVLVQVCLYADLVGSSDYVCTAVHAAATFVALHLPDVAFRC